MIGKAAIVNDDGVVEQVIMVYLDESGEVQGLKGHPMEGRAIPNENAAIGMIRSADGQFRRPDDVGRPDEPGQP